MSETDLNDLRGGESCPYLSIVETLSNKCNNCPEGTCRVNRYCFCSEHFSKRGCSKGIVKILLVIVIPTAIQRAIPSPSEEGNNGRVEGNGMPAWERWQSLYALSLLSRSRTAFLKTAKARGYARSAILPFLKLWFLATFDVVWGCIE